MREEGKQQSMKRKLFLVYLLTLGFFVIIVSFFILTYTKKTLINEVSIARKDILQQVMERANVVKNSSTTASNLFAYDPYLISGLSKEKEHVEDDMDDYLSEQKQAYDTVFEDVGISFDVIVLGENGYYYASHQREAYNFDALKSQLWFKHIDDKKGDITFISSFNDRFGKHEKYVFSASRKLYDRNRKELGTLMINVDEKYLQNLYEPLQTGDNVIYIIDRMGNVISHTDPHLRGLNYFNLENFYDIYEEQDYYIVEKSSGKYLLSYIQNPETGWSIIEEIPTQIVFSQVYDTIQIIITTMIVCLLIAVMVSYYMAYHVTRPLKELRDSMLLVKQGDLSVRSEIKSFREINEMRDAFNDMASKIEILLEEILNQENYRRELELNFLRAQINPHFLYNTLFSIRCMGEMNRKADFIEMIDAFMDLLKTSFSTNTDLICIEQELISTEKYLALQQIRYGHRFTYELELEIGLENVKVPALILQPLVENSIFHGIEAKDDYGHIYIHAYSLNESLFAIDIIDNGLGMEENFVKEIKNQFMNYEIHPRESIGLANVANRIYLTFGEKAEMDIISEKNIGTIIRIILPKEKEVKK